MKVIFEDANMILYFSFFLKIHRLSFSRKFLFYTVLVVIKIVIMMIMMIIIVEYFSIYIYYFLFLKF